MKIRSFTHWLRVGQPADFAQSSVVVRGFRGTPEESNR